MLCSFHFCEHVLVDQLNDAVEVGSTIDHVYINDACVDEINDACWPD